MVDINLLPWRIYLQTYKRKRLLKMSLLIMLLGLLLSMIVHFIKQQIKSDIKKTNAKYLLQNTKCINDGLANQTNQINQYCIDSFKMVGFLQQQTRKAALILLPDNNLAEVEEGEKIGKEKGLVLALSNTGMIIKKNNQDLIVLSF